MRIAVFGGTGRTGRRIIEYALAGGHEVTALVRDPSRLPMAVPQCRPVQGDVLDPDAVATALAGADAVLSALGGAGVSAPGQAISGGMRNIVAGMRRRPVRRVLAVAGSGILDAEEGGLRSDAPGFPELYRAVNNEHLGTWEALRTSDLEWTLVCTPDLVDGERTGGWRAEPERLPPGGTRISVEDTAAFMLSQLRSRQYLQRRVGLAY